MLRSIAQRDAAFRLAHAPGWMLNHSSRTCYLEATYEHLAAELGDPSKRPIEPSKTRCEWTVHTPHGPVSIYDYCFPVDPRDRPSALYEWHVGGHNDFAGRWVAERLSGGQR